MRVDVDGDGLVTAADVVHVTSCQDFDPVESTACARTDVNRAGSITAFDVALIQPPEPDPRSRPSLDP